MRSLSRLLWADLAGLLRARRFWLGAVLMVGYGAFNVLNYCAERARYHADVSTGQAILDFVIMEVYVLAVVSSMHIHTGYYEGTIRNKLTVGHSRAGIYLSALLVQFGAALCYMLAYEGVVLALGLSLLGDVSSVAAVWGQVLCCLLVLLAFTALFTLLAMLVNNRGALVAAVVVAFTLMFTASRLDGRLVVPEMTIPNGQTVYRIGDDEELLYYFFDEQGILVPAGAAELIPNPRYVEEPERSFIGLVLDLSPGGQAIQLVGSSYRRSPLWVLGVNAGAVALLVTGAGLLLFQRKDID